MKRSAILCFGLLGCAVAPEGPSYNEGLNRSADTREGCATPRRYDGRPFELVCANVITGTGTWFASRVLPIAPEGICAYDFETGRAPTAADLSALQAVAVVTPNCDRTGPQSVTMREVPTFDDVRLTGASGCDVCGLTEVARRKTWVLTPPERSTLRLIELKLESGGARAFELIGVSASAKVISVELPEAPKGDRWLPGVLRSR
jgi:hypothetical protein